MADRLPRFPASRSPVTSGLSPPPISDEVRLRQWAIDKATYCVGQGGATVESMPQVAAIADAMIAYVKQTSA